MNNAASVENIFGADEIKFMQFSKTLIDTLETDKTVYSYMPPDEYRVLLHNDWKLGGKIYWEEILGRAHLAAATSIIRSYRWLSGMSSSYSNNLFLPFCASFRALIESAADGYDALGNVAASLAEIRDLVNPILQLQQKQTVLATELENQLIHFSHARKLKRGEVAPDYHNAKQVAEYVKSLESAGLAGLYECYSELCQYTHPAAQSISHLLHPLTDESYSLTPSQDQIYIETMMEQYKPLMLPLFMYSFNPGVLVLKVLMYFDVPQFHSSGVRDLDLRRVGGWPKYAKKMGVKV